MENNIINIVKKPYFIGVECELDFRMRKFIKNLKNLECDKSEIRLCNFREFRTIDNVKALVDNYYFSYYGYGDKNRLIVEPLKKQPYICVFLAEEFKEFDNLLDLLYEEPGFGQYEYLWKQFAARVAAVREKKIQCRGTYSREWLYDKDNKKDINIIWDYNEELNLEHKVKIEYQAKFFL